jgi:vitamin B12 transporter
MTRLPFTLVGLGAFAALPAAAQTVVLPDIIVSANRTATAAAATGASVSVLTEDRIADDGRPFALDLLTTLPGVSVQQNGPAGTVSGFAIRGAPQQYVRVLVDGIEISDPTGPQVSPYLQGLLLDDISSIEVLKGSQSALYGAQAVAGVIDVTSPRPTEPGLETRYLLEGGSYASRRGALTVSGLGERGDFALTAAHLATDGFSAAEEADGNGEADGYDTTRVSGNGTLYLNDTASLFGSAFYQTEDGDYDGTLDGVPVDAPNTFDTRTWGLRGGSGFATGPVEHEVALSYFDIHRRLDEVDPLFGASRYVTDGDRVRVEYLGAWSATESVDLQFGADYSRETTDSSFASGFGTTSSGEQTSWIAGLFAQADWAPVDALTVNAALRQDRHSEFGGELTGRLTAAYALPSDTVLRGSVGTGFVPPSNYQLFDAFSGNPDLDPETSRSADIGLSQGFAADRGQATATLFWLEIDDLIEFDDATFRFTQTDGTARSQGLELAAAWALTDALTLSGAYTYTDARTADDARRNRIPRHALNLALDGAATDRVNLGLGVQYMGDYFDATGPQDTAGFASDFVVVNARVGYEITPQAELYLRAENLTDTEYQTARGFSTAEQSFYFGLRGVF